MFSGLLMGASPAGADRTGHAQVALDQAPTDSGVDMSLQQAIPSAGAWFSGPAAHAISPRRRPATAMAPTCIASSARWPANSRVSTITRAPSGRRSSCGRRRCSTPGWKIRWRRPRHQHDERRCAGPGQRADLIAYLQQVSVRTAGNARHPPIGAFQINRITPGPVPE